MKKILLQILDRQPLLTSSQLDKLSDVCINAGTLFFGTLVVPYFVPDIDKPPSGVIGLGIFLGLALWIISVIIVRERKNDF